MRYLIDDYPDPEVEEWKRCERLERHYFNKLREHPSCQDPDHPGCEHCDDEGAWTDRD